MQNQLNIVQIGNDQSEDDRLVQLFTSLEGAKVWENKYN